MDRLGGIPPEAPVPRSKSPRETRGFCLSLIRPDPETSCFLPTLPSRVWAEPSITPVDAIRGGRYTS
jgi:hypothetical protein